MSELAATSQSQTVPQNRDSLETITAICLRLSTERDVSALLAAILQEARNVTRADAGTLYLHDGDFLTIHVVQNDTLQVTDAQLESLRKLRLPVDQKSVAGAAAFTRDILKLDDVPTTIYYNPEMEKRWGYKTHSMLVVPMQDRGGNPIGVLQLINAKISLPSQDAVFGPFDDADIPLIRSYASIAASALDNAYLYNQQKNMLESYIKAMVKAIDARDPCTAGHSARVSVMSMQIAREMDMDKEQINEVRLASLLHDVGKIGVRESVLTKSTKLSAETMKGIRRRFDHIKYVSWLRTGDMQSRLQEWDAMLEFLEDVNVPSSMLSDDDVKHIQDISSVMVPMANGQSRPLLEPEEVEMLALRKGNLTGEEYKEIQSHAKHTWDILSQIVFPRKGRMQDIPRFAAYHHERYAGRKGYPFGVQGPQIPLQSQIIMCADIFDALTASDRPYKKAMDVEQALQILRSEAESGALRQDVLDAFLRAVQNGRIKPQRRRAEPARDFRKVPRS